VIRLLVVDDSALMRRLMAEVFAAEADFTLAFARNGIEALEQLPAFAPDVIALDLHMPQMDGLACLDRIMVVRPCPVVVVSSLAAEGADATMEAFRLGAVDVVAKPSGALTLHREAWGADVVARMRGAAGARIRTSHRLRERVRHRIGTGRQPQAKVGPRTVPRAGSGLVLVGASTGGPPALEALLTALPADFPWPIVIAQHMPASFTGALAERLDRLCALRVAELVAPAALEPGCAYIARGDADVAISGDAHGLRAMSVPGEPGYPWHPSVDRMVRTAMECTAPDRLVGILMTGMGNDGAAAMAALHCRGGATIAEAEDTAVVWGMPGELVKAGGAGWVEPLPAIGARLCALVPCR
jgi:two-component system chemotaxis response regulator CheB